MSATQLHEFDAITTAAPFHPNVSPFTRACHWATPALALARNAVRCPRVGWLRVAAALSLGQVLLGCGPQLDLPVAESQVSEYGQAAFALTAESSDKSYALRHATFSISGADTLLLNTDDDPSATTLVQEMPSGAYSIELLPGYALLEMGADGETEVEATLQTPNPQSIVVSPDQTTTVTYLFQTAGKPVTFGPGSLAVAIEVEQAEALGLVISEFMVNPSALADTAGEWIELANTSTEPVSLEGCRVLRDGAGFTFASGVVVPAQGTLTLANSETPGFAPDYVYSGLTLPNSAPFVLTVDCNGTILDEIHVDPSAWPVSAGISAALTSAAMSATKNDTAQAWCLSGKSYGSDYGTPGSANDACAQ